MERIKEPKCNISRLNDTKVILHNLNMNKRSKRLKISYFQIIGRLCCSAIRLKTTLKKFNLYDRGKSLLDSYLDILKIVKLEEEFEKLMLILLNKHQLSMFHFISKDIYSLEEKEEKEN
jgi:hypothetical protein